MMPLTLLSLHGKKLFFMLRIKLMAVVSNPILSRIMTSPGVFLDIFRFMPVMPAAPKCSAL